MKKEPKMTGDAPMYVYATEMVASYYKRLQLPDKRVLTVAGSGDQVINAIFYGARQVVGFDINRNALFITELKLAAIRLLSYPEFLRFFSQRKNGFNYSLYRTLRPSLSKACRRYFDHLYKVVGVRGLGTSRYFRNRHTLIYTKRDNVRLINAYLSSKVAYNKVKAILKHTQPTLRLENVLALTASKKLWGKFDVINLSNVPNYLSRRSFELDEEEMISYFRKLKKLVRAQGIIFFYSYSDSIYPHSMSLDIPAASRVSFLKKLKKSGIFKVSRKSFGGTSGNRDRITILAC
jgi:hypothetical protein